MMIQTFLKFLRVFSHNSMCTDDNLPVIDYFFFTRKSAATCLSNGGPYPPQISTKLVAYEVRANSCGVRVFNFQEGIVEEKIWQSNVYPNKASYIQLVDLKN